MDLLAATSNHNASSSSIVASGGGGGDTLTSLWTAVTVFVLGSAGVKNSTKCYGSLGCLHLSEDWYGLSRPVNVLPQERYLINTQFILRTKDTKHSPSIWNATDADIIFSTAFNPNRDTKIIVHGFIDTGFVTWVEELSDALLSTGDFNVIAVDWGGGSAVLYGQAAANARLVGLEVANLIELLASKYGSDPMSFHMIGHSLGSHVAGYTGEALKAKGIGTLGRISALDPAEPLFQSMPEFVRLDPSDADYVDAIHTDAKSILMFGYGMEQPVGHVDFYPNGGTDQPGCSLLDLPVNLNAMVNAQTATDDLGRHLVACSHTRAIHLYIESIRQDSDCIMVGQECSTYEEFKMGLCFTCGRDSQHCAFMGYRADEYKPVVEKYGRQNVKFYLDTSSNATAYCQYHYLLELNLAQPSDAEKWVQGTLRANLYGTKNEVLDLNLTPEPVSLLPGFAKGLVVKTSKDLGTLTSLDLRWENTGDFFICWSCESSLYVRSVRHRPILKPTTSPRDNASVICGDSRINYVDIQSGQWKLFYKSC